MSTQGDHIMNDPMSDLKGLQPEVKTKLESEGIRNTTQFLEHTRTHQQRAELAHKVGTTLVAIKELANRADLMRLRGVGGDFSNMLEEAGVNSCRELQHRVPEKLYKTLEAIHADKKIGHRVPTLFQTTEWITEAKTLAATSPV
jgi:predicted flap endonuclease-1-like 5' DNA nuclease